MYLLVSGYCLSSRAPIAAISALPCSSVTPDFNLPNTARKCAPRSSVIGLSGPVMVIIRAKDVDAALAVENASPYGNAASVFTESGAVARYVMEKASAGMVGVNVGVPVPREPFSFGGWNESRFGVGDITGRGSIEFWTKSKKMTTKWNKEAGVNWMS